MCHGVDPDKNLSMEFTESSWRKIFIGKKSVGTILLFYSVNLFENIHSKSKTQLYLQSYLLSHILIFFNFVKVSRDNILLALGELLGYNSPPFCLYKAL